MLDSDVESMADPRDRLSVGIIMHAAYLYIVICGGYIIELIPDIGITDITLNGCVLLTIIDFESTPQPQLEIHYQESYRLLILPILRMLACMAIY